MVLFVLHDSALRLGGLAKIWRTSGARHSAGMRTGAILAVGTLLCSAAPVAQTARGDSAKPAATHSDPNKIVCKKEETIGSRIGAKKVCLTGSEWDMLAKDGREQTERVQSGVRLCSEPQSC